MKYFVLTAFIVFASTIMQAQCRTQVVMQFSVTQSYCGGAAPTEGVLNDLKNKPPFAFKTIYVYKGDKCIDSLTTDSIGTIRKKFKKGKYNLLLPYKHFKTVPFGENKEFDMTCMQAEWKTADATLEVKFGSKILINKRIGHQFCSWQYNCLKERHIPPSAPKQN